MRMTLVSGDILQHFRRVNNSLGEFESFVDPFIWVDRGGGLLAVGSQLLVSIEIGHKTEQRFVGLLLGYLVVPKAVQLPTMFDFEKVAAVVAAGEAMRRKQGARMK